MMKPEPSERLSERGEGVCGPWPGPGRGMKRRKNSWISSSSRPGTCGSAWVRRTACVVLMLTTAAPCSSTSRVKSGRSRLCARAAAQNAASHRAATAFIVCMNPLLSPLAGRLLNGGPIRHGFGYALHACRGRLAHDGDAMVGEFASIDVDRPEARHPGAAFLPRLQRLDEDRHRGKPVRVHELAHRARLAHAALELHHLAEAGQLGIDAPAFQACRNRIGILD